MCIVVLSIEVQVYFKQIGFNSQQYNKLQTIDKQVHYSLKNAIVEQKNNRI